MNPVLEETRKAVGNDKSSRSKLHRYLGIGLATVLCPVLFIQPAFAGRPADKQRIYLGNFSAPATIQLTGVLLPGTTAVGNVGDQATFDAELFSTDPDEDGEGEPLDVMSQPSMNSGTSHYYETKRFSFTIAKQGQTLTANIEGYDADESASITGWIDPAPPKNQLTDDQKAALAEAGERVENLAANEDVAAKACVALKVIPENICGIFETFSVSDSLLAEADKNLALDPPDPNFTVIAQPIIPVLPSITLTPGLTQAEVDAYNALILNSLDIVGTSNAMLTAINRAVGAYDANNDPWEMKQREAAAIYSLQLSSLTRERVTLLANAQAAWKKGSIGTLNVTPNDVLSSEYQLIYYGLPPTYVQKLQQLGVDATTIETIRNRLRVQNINDASGALPDVLTKSLLVNSLNNAADAFYNSALDNATPLSDGQHVKGEGVVSNSTNDLVTSSNIHFEFEVNASDSGKLSSELKFSVQSYAHNFLTTDSKITRAALLGNMAILEGTYSASDATTGTFRITATDSSKEGKGKDKFTVSLSNGYQISGVLDRGSIKIHAKPNDD